MVRLTWDRAWPTAQMPSAPAPPSKQARNTSTAESKPTSMPLEERLSTSGNRLIRAASGAPMSSASSHCMSKCPPKSMVAKSATSPTSPPATMMVTSKHQLTARFGWAPGTLTPRPPSSLDLSARVTNE